MYSSNKGVSKICLVLQDSVCYHMFCTPRQLTLRILFTMCAVVDSYQFSTAFVCKSAIIIIISISILKLLIMIMIILTDTHKTMHIYSLGPSRLFECRQFSMKEYYSQNDYLNKQIKITYTARWFFANVLLIDLCSQHDIIIRF